MKDLDEERDDKIWKEWMTKAKAVKSQEQLADFMKELNSYGHDYGTICHAISAAGVAAMHSMASGITGFQAGCIMWEVISGWGAFGEGPMRIQKFEDLMYPQYKQKFTTIPKESWDQVVKKAKEQLKDFQGEHSVGVHMKSVAQGNVPFGLGLSDD